ncbi:MAG TPA: hypothetical protein PK095_10115, partial [Myxococcota bacterium]|nr:hypothetical protein [Myxococcota bacterium]
MDQGGQHRRALDEHREELALDDHGLRALRGRGVLGARKRIERAGPEREDGLLDLFVADTEGSLTEVLDGDRAGVDSLDAQVRARDLGRGERRRDGVVAGALADEAQAVMGRVLGRFVAAAEDVDPAVARRE